MILLVQSRSLRPIDLPVESVVGNRPPGTLTEGSMDLSAYATIDTAP